MFALVDCNNFYASCERVFNPQWNNRPIVILSNNDGCVIARSNEAKALGIPMGAPYFKYKNFIQGHNVIVCSSNYSLYGDMSSRVMTVLRKFTPEMQIYSIDEAFLKFERSVDDNTGYKIRDTVLRWTGIPVSIGIATTKTLAKVANHHVKKNPDQKGVCILKSELEINEQLETLPVTEIWGIGKQQGVKLNRLGIVTAKDFSDAEDGLIKKHLSIVGLRTAQELRGISCLPLNETPPPKKSVTCSRSFGKAIESKELIDEAVANYTARAAEKIRAQNSLATMITVFVELHPFRKVSPGCYHIRITLPEPTNFTPTLITCAKEAVKHLYQPGSQYRKAGVILEGLVSEKGFQQDLFTYSNNNCDKQQKLMQTVDKLNIKYGHPVIQTAAEGIDKAWKMKQNLCSQKFTTSWDDLLNIKI